MANYWKIRQLGPNVITAETRIPNYELAADVYIRLTGKKILQKYITSCIWREAQTPLGFTFQHLQLLGVEGEKKKHCMV